VNRAARTVVCPQNLVEISSFSSSQIIGRTSNGTVFIQNIGHSSSETIAMATEQNITGVQVLATSSQVPIKASGVRRSASASVLGENRNVSNIQIRPSTSQNVSNVKGKATAESNKNVRVVSAPSQSQKPSALRPLSSRSTSQPIARQPRPSSSMAHLPAIQDEEEGEDAASAPQECHHAGEQSLDLTWALRAGQATRTAPQPALDVNSAEELRREISNLQLDMLRMARGLKVCSIVTYYIRRLI